MPRKNNINNTNENRKLKIINKGTGAGGANTNYHGKKFEEITTNYNRLLNAGFDIIYFNKKRGKIYDNYLSKKIDNKTIIYVLQQ